MQRLLFLFVMASVTLLASATNVFADDTECNGFLTGTFDNVVVPPGATCFLSNSFVAGNVKALENSTLFSSRNNIQGNLEGDKPLDVTSFFDTVSGNIQFADVTPPPGFLFFVTVINTTLTNGNLEILKNNSAVLSLVNNTVLNGNVKVEENNTTGDFVVSGNRVAQNLQVFKNRGSAQKRVQANTVGQDLQCFENRLNFTGGHNTAQKSEGQCF